MVMTWLVDASYELKVRSHRKREKPKKANFFLTAAWTAVSCWLDLGRCIQLCQFSAILCQLVSGGAAWSQQQWNSDVARCKRDRHTRRPILAPPFARRVHFHLTCARIFLCSPFPLPSLYPTASFCLFFHLDFVHFVCFLFSVLAFLDVCLIHFQSFFSFSVWKRMFWMKCFCFDLDFQPFFLSVLDDFCWGNICMWSNCEQSLGPTECYHFRCVCQARLQTYPLVENWYVDVYDTQFVDNQYWYMMIHDDMWKPNIITKIINKEVCRIPNQHIVWFVCTICCHVCIFLLICKSKTNQCSIYYRFNLERVERVERVEPGRRSMAFDRNLMCELGYGQYRGDRFRQMDFVYSERVKQCVHRYTPAGREAEGKLKFGPVLCQRNAKWYYDHKETTWKMSMFDDVITAKTHPFDNIKSNLVELRNNWT